MFARIRGRLTFSNVISVLALFAALGLGTAWALERNSVRSKHIVNEQVKQRDLAVPEQWNEVGDADGPAFGESFDGFCGWENHNSESFNSAAFYRDPQGRVHLKGIVKWDGDGCGDPSTVQGTEIFELPDGYEPAKYEVHPVVSNDLPGAVYVQPAAANPPTRGVRVQAGAPTNWVSLDGISFRCAPSGQNGCP